MRAGSEPAVGSARMVSFSTSQDHLLAELARIDLLIRHRVAQARAAAGPEEQLRGLVISETEIDEVLGRGLGALPWSADGALPRDLSDALGRLRQEIDARCEAGRGRGIVYRLHELERRFGLSRLETETLLLCLAPEIDPRYERLFGYLHDDVTRKRPSVHLVSSLLCSGLGDRLRARRLFEAAAPLRRLGLVATVDDSARPGAGLSGRDLRIEGRVASFLLDSDELDAELARCARLEPTSVALDRMVLDREFRGRVQRLLDPGGLARGPACLYLRGSEGAGRRTLAAALGAELGVALLVVDLSAVAARPLPDLETALRRAHREARLQDAAILWHGCDTLQEEAQAAKLSLLLRWAGEVDGPTFLAGDAEWQPAIPTSLPWLSISVPRPSHAERMELWKRSLGPTERSGDLDIEAVATAFRLVPGQIERAAAAASAAARAVGGDAARLTTADLLAACRRQSSRRLARLAQKIEPHYAWEDIVLPTDRLEQLRELCDQIRYRARVLEEWGFGRKLSLGKGLNVLFAGPPGTGKTMAAEIIAGRLGLELYKIDLASVVSKYIGETEKNLREIFREAEAGNVVLFFDEADALFGKRTEVRDSHDRYANIETSYLLQRMEEYEGAVILATNLRKNMDDAFVRRIHFTVEFPFPDAGHRQRIWQGIWPDETPLDDDLDFDFLAGRLELTGGNIRNIALAAAFLAASDGGRITMAHLLHAARREYQKMGKVLAEGEIGYG